MREYRYTAETEKFFEYARMLDGAQGELTSAGFMVASVDFLTRDFGERDEELYICVSAFLPGECVDIREFRRLLTESMTSPKSERDQKYDRAYIEAVIADADFMAEKQGRECITPKDVFLCIITRRDKVTQECFLRSKTWHTELSFTERMRVFNEGRENNPEGMEV
ncbi:MAG: hypothetical protein IJB74_09220 [Clostridia bacterium]|nr:hypothetical protein [Clostridia bacterium]